MLKLFSRWTRLRLRLRGVEVENREFAGFDVRYYSSEGNPHEPWLLLHGLGSTALTWHTTLATLAGCRVWVPELSELGGTRGPDPALNVRQGADAMARLLETLSPGQPATVCGISLGGWMAVRLALARPDLVSRVVLINCAGFLDQDWEAIERLIRVRDRDDVSRLYGALFVRTPWILRLSRGTFLEAFTSNAVEHILSTLSENDAFDERELAGLGQPTQLIWGRWDGLFPLETGERMAAAIPDSRLAVLDAAHGVHWEFPRRMNAVIEDFRHST